MQARHLPSVVIVGAGPAGLAAAHELAASGAARVTLVQRGGGALYQPGILPAIIGARPVSAFRRNILIEGITVRVGEALTLDDGFVLVDDGCVLRADAIIAAPGLWTDASVLPRGPRTFPVWELDAAHMALPAVRRWSGGRLIVAISSLPYRCPPAPYGLAMTLHHLARQRGVSGEVLLVTPEDAPLRALGEHVTRFLVEALREAGVELVTGFHPDFSASTDGALVAEDGRALTYELGLFVPPHRRPAILGGLPGDGPLVPVDGQQMAAERLWLAGDVVASSLPRAAGVAEAQGRTAARSVLAALGLAAPAPPVIPAPSCYVWITPEQAARIQVRFPRGLPPEGAPEVTIEPPSASLMAESLAARDQWERQLS